ncbi:MAG: phosphate-starvation-inducible PsiE family protein [Nitrososphaerota archaeon]|nr:phosphate-starvation-inducible PsiE family protein [Nitrososphaerota archaeon]
MISYISLESTLQEFITDILNIVILLELMALVSQYFSKERIKLEYALDAAAIFIIREIIIKIYPENISIITLAALTTVLVVIILLRTIAIRYSPDKM